MSSLVPLPAPPDDACLGFVNTRYWRGSAEPTETLGSPRAVLEWAATGPVLPGLSECQATAWHGGLLALREVLFRLLAAAAAAAPPAPDDLAAFNAALAEAPARRRLCDAGDAYGVAPAAGSMAALLAPVLWSAADLLAGRRRASLRQCANPLCGWLFLDDSKSGNRRWCMMSACGNRAKARRHYLKRKQEGK
ncbi:MAG TPA: ABATE domain-containing protein [Acetobacteraceae bacterium]|jgi:predicted RNA-binding Zn ribbon-like protein|nr:ABATE domain-containing protein [Acetobacteraceae bacterium]